MTNADKAAVRTWLHEIKLLSPEELHGFGEQISTNDTLIDAIIKILEDTKNHDEFLVPICEQLFVFCRGNEESLQQFSMYFIPTLLGLYLTLLHTVDKTEVVDSEGKPVVSSFTIPSPAKPSIYHEVRRSPRRHSWWGHAPPDENHSPATTTTVVAHPLVHWGVIAAATAAVPGSPHATQQQLTENALNRLELGETRIFLGPFEEFDSLNAANRQDVATVLMRVYNQNIGFMPSVSRAGMLRMGSKLVLQGCRTLSNKGGADDDKPRVSLSSEFLLELVQAVYFSMFNGLFESALHALERIHRRAMVNMLPDVLLATGAIKNALEEHSGDGPLGIKTMLTSTSGISKALLTNASFKTKKMKEDLGEEDGEKEGEGREGDDGEEEEGAAEGEKEAAEGGEEAGGGKAAAAGLESILEEDGAGGLGGGTTAAESKTKLNHTTRKDATQASSKLTKVENGGVNNESGGGGGSVGKTQKTGAVKTRTSLHDDDQMPNGHQQTRV